MRAPVGVVRAPYRGLGAVRDRVSAPGPIGEPSSLKCLTAPAQGKDAGAAALPVSADAASTCRKAPTTSAYNPGGVTRRGSARVSDLGPFRLEFAVARHNIGRARALGKGDGCHL